MFGQIGRVAIGEHDPAAAQCQATQIIIVIAYGAKRTSTRTSEIRIADTAKEKALENCLFSWAYIDSGGET
jgi:hypothetical protein